jgi:hypothetical protein
VVAARLLQTEDGQARLDAAPARRDETHARLTALLGETRAVLDESRAQLRGAWARAGDRPGAASG